MWRITLRSIAAHRRRLLATGLAVLLGVAFLAGTLVLYHTLINGFSDVIAEANKGTDALVRSSLELGQEERTERGLIDRSLADTIAAVDGVAAVALRIENNGRIVGADGDPIGGGGPTIAGNWVDDDRLNPYDLAEGRAPAAPGEVVIDKAAAEEGDLAVGDRTVVRTPDPLDVTIVGVATFGSADSQGSATYAGFTTGFADKVLMPKPGKASSIAVAAEPGVSQAELVRRLDAVLPDGVEALTGAELTREMEEETQGEDHEAFQQALILFAGVALVVATFTIYNTFSILVTQRTRESALLRALGASRGQVLGSVTTEALAVGLLASVGGIAAGMALALGLLALMDAIGLTTPASPLVLDASTVTIALAVGVVVTLVASLAPAVRASRVAPLAALRDVAVDRSATSGRRAVAGAVVTGAGIALTIVGATGEALLPTGLGALATLIGVVVLGPVAATPTSAISRISSRLSAVSTSISRVRASAAGEAEARAAAGSTGGRRPPAILTAAGTSPGTSSTAACAGWSGRPGGPGRTPARPAPLLVRRHRRDAGAARCDPRKPRARRHQLCHRHAASRRPLGQRHTACRYDPPHRLSGEPHRHRLRRSRIGLRRRQWRAGDGTALGG